MSDKIHATVKHGLMHNFESVLEEGAVVMLSKFIVGDNKKLKYPMTQHKYKLTFLRGTNIRRCLSWNGPVNGFNFFPFSEISLHGQDEHLPVDIIGVVQHCTDLDVYNKTKDGSEGGEIGEKMTLDVQDENGVIEKLQLWDDYAQKFHDYVSATKRKGTVILLQFGRIRLWVEKGTLSFQNAKFGTKMWIDDNDVPEIVEFRATFNSKIANGSSSQGGSVLSSQVTHSGVSDFLNPKLKKTIEDIVGSTEPMICVVLAEIQSFQKEHGWNYIGCRKCKKKVLKKSEMVNDIEGNATVDEGKLYCPKCKEMTAAVFVSFKVHIRVQDANGTANFVMFDTPVMKLIKKRASEIHDKQQKDGNDDFPDEFSHLVDKNVLFKVEVSSFNTDFDYDVYTVNKVCTDPTTISDFINLIPENQNGDQEI